MEAVGMHLLLGVRTDLKTVEKETSAVSDRRCVGLEYGHSKVIVQV